MASFIFTFFLSIIYINMHNIQGFARVIRTYCQVHFLMDKSRLNFNRVVMRDGSERFTPAVSLRSNNNFSKRENKITK